MPHLSVIQTKLHVNDKLLLLFPKV